MHRRERKPLKASEPLARLRTDLQIVHKPKGAQIAYTLVKGSGEGAFDFDLYEVEYAVAKSFDGERSAIDIAADLRGRGIVVGVEQVLSFFRELRGMGFIDGAEITPPEGSSPASGDRDRFVNEGRQHLSTGQPDYAEQYFLAALELDSACQEALDGLSEVEAARAASRPETVEEDEDDERTRVDPVLFMDDSPPDGVPAAVETSEPPPVGKSPPTPRSLPYYYPTPSQLHTPSFGYAPVPLPSFGTNPGFNTNPGFGTNPGFVDPITGQQHTGPISLPMQAAPAKQSSALLIALGASITVVGILIGYILFSDRGDGGGERERAASEAAEAETKVATPAPVAAPDAAREVAAAPAPDAPVEPATVAEADAAPADVTVAVDERRQPILARVEADEEGAVTRVDAKDGDTVRRGSTILKVRVRNRARSRKVRDLKKRVDELEVLAADDPVYKDFLARAKADLRAAREMSRSRSHEIEAPAAGVFRAERIGERVRKGQLIGTIVDPKTWQLSASTTAAVDPAWSCKVELGDDSAPCAIAKVETRDATRDIVAAVASEDAPWLADGAQLVLTPGSAGPRPQ